MLFAVLGCQIATARPRTHFTHAVTQVANEPVELGGWSRSDLQVAAPIIASSVEKLL
jgi:hypothetical protein